jgi:hypothetical protein
MDIVRAVEIDVRNDKIKKKYLKDLGSFIPSAGSPEEFFAIGTPKNFFSFFL